MVGSSFVSTITYIRDIYDTYPVLMFVSLGYKVSHIAQYSSGTHNSWKTGPYKIYHGIYRQCIGNGWVGWGVGVDWGFGWIVRSG